MARQRPAAGNEFQRVGSVRRGHGGTAMPGKFAAVDPIDDRWPAHRRKGKADGILGEAIDRCHRLGTKAVGCKPCREAPDRFGAYRLRSVGDHSQRGQIQARNHRVLDSAQAKLKGEVGRGRQRRPMPMDRPQPRLGSNEEGEGRHHDQRNREVQAAKPSADQAHVVVERQPTCEDVGRADIHCLAHGPDIGQQIGVRQDDSLGVARAARGVLKQRRAGRARCSR